MLLEEVDRAIFTCPAIFSVQKWQVLFDAAIMAGFSRARRIEEPTAATLMVARAGKGILVYDLGVGTFDLSVARQENGSF